MKFSVAVIVTCGSLATAQSLKQPTSRHLQDLHGEKNWWEFGLPDEVLEEVALYYLGQTWHQSADVAEVLQTIHKVNISDPWSWTKEWAKLAERMEHLAAESEATGNGHSAGLSYLRAATYYRASLHRHPDPFADDVPELTKLEIKAFENFLHFSDYPCESVRFPYEGNMTLPGYLCINPNVNGPAPTIIFNEGKDGWAEDGKFIIDEAMKRNYHTFLWDGPGMGKVIRLQGLPFRHDWENVLAPLIDYLVQIPQVDAESLALISLSLGGFLAPRAAAYEHRLKAIIPNPGVLDWHKVYADTLDGIAPGLLDTLHTDPGQFDAFSQDLMSQSDFLRWGLIDSMWHHGVDTPSGLMMELERYRIRDVVQNITAATLVIDAEAEERGQSMELYNALSNDIRKDYIKFTATEAAQFHVQPGATAILTTRMFDWLDDVMEPETVSAAMADPTSNAFPVIQATLSTACMVLLLTAWSLL